jgi:hypothetical protein
MKTRCGPVAGPELLLSWVGKYDAETRAAVKQAVTTVVDLQARAASLGAAAAVAPPQPQHQVENASL